MQLVAGTAAGIPEVLSLLRKEGIKVEGNPDVYIREYQRFGIEEARELRDRSSLRSVSGLGRIFIIATPGMTAPAQNALLKTLEEPSANASFFIIVPAPETLLQTLRSRAQILVLGGDSERASSVDARMFLSASPQKRLDMLAELLKKDEDEHRDIGAIISFLASLERHMEKRPAGLHAIYRARKYIGDSGALVKPLLEQVALLVPKV